MLKKNGLPIIKAVFSASAWVDEPLTSEQADFLTFVRHSNYYYNFENVIKLDRDFEMIYQKVF